MPHRGLQLPGSRISQGWRTLPFFTGPPLPSPPHPDAFMGQGSWGSEDLFKSQP